MDSWTTAQSRRLRDQCENEPCHRALVYTWKWENDLALGGPDDTIVTVESHDREKQTEVIPTQEGFTNTPARDEHGRGWVGCLDRLGTLVIQGWW